MTVRELRPYLKDRWSELRAQLGGIVSSSADTAGRNPQTQGRRATARVPTVLDRFLQQALQQELTSLFEPRFSPHSYGFRPGRSGHDAVKQATGYVEAGYGLVVDLDLDQFFDRVNHDMLMARVARVLKDKRVLRLIRRYLESGAMVNGAVVATEEGTPQNKPIFACSQVQTFVRVLSVPL
jgi:RNA-directed DNA polymerase